LRQLKEKLKKNLDNLPECMDFPQSCLLAIYLVKGRFFKV